MRNRLAALLTVSLAIGALPASARSDLPRAGRVTVRVFDVSEPAHAFEVAANEVPGFPRGLWVTNDRVYLAAQGGGLLVEVQGTAEREPFSQSTLQSLLQLANSGIEELFTRQKQTLGISN